MNINNIDININMYPLIVDSGTDQLYYIEHFIISDVEGWRDGGENDNVYQIFFSQNISWEKIRMLMFSTLHKNKMNRIVISRLLIEIINHSLERPKNVRHSSTY